MVEVDEEALHLLGVNEEALHLLGVNEEALHLLGVDGEALHLKIEVDEEALNIFLDMNIDLCLISEVGVDEKLIRRQQIAPLDEVEAQHHPEGGEPLFEVGRGRQHLFGFRVPL